jgi:excisionase family DNA binding protein
MDGTMAVSSNNGEAAALPATGYPERMIPAQAASYLGVAEETLAIWRCTKRYSLSYIKVGRLVQYRKSDLDAFLAARTVEASRDA